MKIETPDGANSSAETIDESNTATESNPAGTDATATDAASTDLAVPEQAPETPMFWVGIGASAGGLEALRGFVRSVPPTLPATYIVTQHMAPHHRSMLVEIISRETDLPVQDVVDGMKPIPNVVYITPPNTNCVVDGDVLRLTEPSPGVAAPKPSVDIFFRSLADARGEHAVGIILSGTGSDGSDGIRAVRAGGGITIAQDDATATQKRVL